MSLGPVGRSAGTDVHGGKKGASAAFSYAHSKGLFFGVSLEASVIAARSDVNRLFYGLEVSPSQLLSGVHPRPKAAEPLYAALDEVLGSSSAGSGQEVTADGRGGRIYSRIHPMGPEDEGDVDDRSGPTAAGVAVRNPAQIKALEEEHRYLREKRAQGSVAAMEERRGEFLGMEELSLEESALGEAHDQEERAMTDSAAAQRLLQELLAADRAMT